MPTATSIGEGDLIRISARAKAMPKRMSPHGISPPTMPCAIWAMRPACGAGSAGSPMPMPPWRMLPSCRITIGKTRTNEVTIVATISATSIFQGVPPRIWPDLQVLDQAAGDAAGAADDRRDAEHRADARRAR